MTQRRPRSRGIRRRRGGSRVAEGGSTTEAEGQQQRDLGEDSLRRHDRVVRVAGEPAQRSGGHQAEDDESQRSQPRPALQRHRDDESDGGVEKDRLDRGTCRTYSVVTGRKV